MKQFSIAIGSSFELSKTEFIMERGRPDIMVKQWYKDSNIDSFGFNFIYIILIKLSS